MGQNSMQIICSGGSIFGANQHFKINSGEKVDGHYTDDIVDIKLHGITVEEYPKLINNHQIVGRLYRRNFLIDDGIRFSNTRKNAEDLLFSFYTLIYAKKISLIPQCVVYRYYIGNYYATATLSKLNDAKYNLLETIEFVENHGSNRMKNEMRRKAAEFVSSLGRAEYVFAGDKNAFLRYICGLRRIVRKVDEKTLAELPIWRRDIARFISSGYFTGALSRWNNRRLYQSKWKVSA